MFSNLEGQVCPSSHAAPVMRYLIYGIHPKQYVLDNWNLPLVMGRQYIIKIHQSEGMTMKHFHL